MLSNEQMSKFYQEPLNFVKKYELKENEYLIINDINGMTIDKYCYQNENLRKILFPTITNDYNRTIKPRNEQQVLAVDMLQDRTSKVKLIRGVYGSGKFFATV